MLLIDDWRQLSMGRDDRATLIGATGTGKTTLARFLVEDKYKRNSVVYNNKPSDAVDKWIQTQQMFYNFDDLEYTEANRIIYTPPVKESLNADLQDRFFDWIYYRRFTRLYVDEANALRGGTNPSYYLQACICRGRERGIGVITGTQRPYRVPIILMSEAEHFYIFRLNMLVDRQRVYELTGISVDEQTDLEQYEFFYYNAILGQRSNRLRINPSRVTPHTLSHFPKRSNTNARSKTAFTIPLQYAAT